MIPARAMLLYLIRRSINKRWVKRKKIKKIIEYRLLKKGIYSKKQYHHHTFLHNQLTCFPGKINNRKRVDGT